MEEKETIKIPAWEDPKKIGDKFIEFATFTNMLIAITIAILIIQGNGIAAYMTLGATIILNLIPIIKRKQYERRKKRNNQ